MTRGHTLLELLLTVALLGAVVSIAAAGTVRYRDLAAVTAARETAAGVFARARVLAVASGGVTVVVDSAEARIVAPDGRALVVEAVGADDGVRVVLPGDDRLEARYDPMGIGRLSSGTVRFRRGAAERALVVSAYGRVARR